MLHLPQSDEDLHYFKLGGIRATCKKVAHLKASVLLESALEEAYKALQVEFLHLRHEEAWLLS